MSTCKLLWLLFYPLLLVAPVRAQLAVAVERVQATGQKAVVPLVMSNRFGESIDSARAVCFVLDDAGKMVAQATRWVIGGTKDRPPLASGATNTFHFVVASEKPFTTTNLTARLSFTRIVLAGGKLADPSKDVKLAPALPAK
jgi:hypothetical protein